MIIGSAATSEIAAYWRCAFTTSTSRVYSLGINRNIFGALLEGNQELCVMMLSWWVPRRAQIKRQTTALTGSNLINLILVRGQTNIIVVILPSNHLLQPLQLRSCMRGLYQTQCLWVPSPAKFGLRIICSEVLLMHR